MKLSLHDKSLLYHELAKLTTSGFGFDKSAELLLQQAPNRAIAAWATEVLSRLQQGQSIAAALHQPARGLGSLDFSIVQAAERGGVLEDAFSYLRDLYSSQLRARRSLTARLLYPAALLHLAVFLPALPPLILGTSATQQFRESALILALLYGMGAVLYLVWIVLDRSASRSTWADRILRTIPLLGKARRLGSLQRFAAAFRFSLLAALRISDALLHAGAASGSAVLDLSARKLARNAEQGRSLGTLLPQSRELPPDFRRSLCTAEVSGALPQDLLSWTRSFAQEQETQILRLGTVLPTAATLLVAAFVAWRLITFYAGVVNAQTQFLEGLW